MILPASEARPRRVAGAVDGGAAGVLDPNRMYARMGHEPRARIAFQPDMQLEALPILTPKDAMDRRHLRRSVAGAQKARILPAPSIRHVVVAEKAGGVGIVQPLLHLRRSVGGVGHAGGKVVEEIAQ